MKLRKNQIISPKNFPFPPEEMKKSHGGISDYLRSCNIVTPLPQQKQGGMSIFILGTLDETPGLLSDDQSHRVHPLCMKDVCPLWQG